MRRRINKICEKEAAETRRKSIDDAIYGIEAEKNRRAYARQLDYKRRIEHVRLGVQAQYEELRNRDREGETCPNCGVKRMRVRMRPLQPFLDTVWCTSPGPGVEQSASNHMEAHVNRTAQEMNEAIKEVIAERRRNQLTGVWGFIGTLPRPIGLLDESVREGRRVWALPSPFLDTLYGRDIISPFPIAPHL